MSFSAQTMGFKRETSSCSLYFLFQPPVVYDKITGRSSALAGGIAAAASVGIAIQRGSNSNKTIKEEKDEEVEESLVDKQRGGEDDINVVDSVDFVDESVGGVNNLSNERCSDRQ